MLALESLYQEQYPFGLGTDTWASLHNPVDRFGPALGIRERAKQTGWSHGCPFADRLTDPRNTQYGPLYMFRRYAEVNCRFRMIVGLARDENRTLHEQLVTSTSRLPGEPVGIFEPESVPASHETLIAPMAALPGYGLPRVSLEFDKVERSFESMYALVDLIKSSETPQELLVRLSQRAVAASADPIKILSHGYSANILAEENTRTLYAVMPELYQQHAPYIWRTYESLLKSERAKFGIAEVPNI